MKLVPLKSYARPNLPTLAELAARRNSAIARAGGKRGRQALAALMIAGSALFAGCGNTTVSQDVMDYWDRALEALHLRPKPYPQPQMLMGALGYSPPTTSQQQQPISNTSRQTPPQ